MSTEQSKAKNAEGNAKSVAEFQQLRKDQRHMANNLTTLEMDSKEHKTVIETLKGVDADRKCFRLIGGILVERTVKEILPQLAENKDCIEKRITQITEDLTKKGQQINKFKDEHDIKFCSEQMSNEPQKPKEDEKKSENRNEIRICLPHKEMSVLFTNALNTKLAALILYNMKTTK